MSGLDASAAERWARLGCPPTADPLEIRRAYARALKQIDPDRDPDAFQSLRQAFETLLAQATSAPTEDHTAAITPLIQQIRAHRQTGDTTGAITLVDQFIAAHPPGDPVIAAASVAIFHTMALERRLSPPLFRHLVDRFDWRDATSPLAQAAPQKHAVLLARLEAEEWLDRLRADIPNPDRIAATLLLQAATVPKLDRPQKERAAATLSQLSDHAQFLLDRFDGNSLARLREAIEGPPLLATPPPAATPAPPPVKRGRRLLGRLRDVAIIYAILIAVGLIVGFFQSNEGENAPNPATQARQALESTPERWVYLRRLNDQVQVYFTQLLTDRAAIREIRYGVDRPVPDQIFPLPTTPAKYPQPIPAGMQTGIAAPATLQYVTVQLAYVDGTTSLIRKYVVQGEAQ